MLSYSTASSTKEVCFQSEGLGVRDSDASEKGSIHANTLTTLNLPILPCKPGLCLCLHQIQFRLVKKVRIGWLMAWNWEFHNRQALSIFVYRYPTDMFTPMAVPKRTYSSINFTGQYQGSFVSSGTNPDTWFGNCLKVFPNWKFIMRPKLLGL